MKVKVVYWRGTMEFEGVATTYRGAMRIADRTQNTMLPRFYDAQTGEPLHDDGQGLVYESSLDDDVRRYAM